MSVRIISSFKKLSSDKVVNNCKCDIEVLSQENILDIHQEGQTAHFDDKMVWNPFTDLLVFRINIDIKKPEMFYDNQNWIVMPNAEIGMACIWTCKASLSRGVVDFDETINQFSKPFSTMKKITFAHGTLKDEISLHVVFYIKKRDENNTLSYIANKEGMIIGDIRHFTLRLEGNGASFPIQIVNDKTKPLWFIVDNLSDTPEEDYLSLETFCLYINEGHKDYCWLNPRSNKFNRSFMQDVFASAIVVLIQSAFEKNPELKENIKQTEFEVGTIGFLIKYYIENKDVKVNSISELSKSIRTNFLMGE